MRQCQEDEAARSDDESTKSSGVPSEPRPGHRLDRYEFLRLYAQGGMGSLWAARQLGDHGFQKRVAIKTILPHLAGQSHFRKMFLGEAKIASRIDHPNVARVLDLGERSDLLYLVMEWIDGCSLTDLGPHLAAVKDERGTMILLRILIDACAGLHAAHELYDPEGSFLSVVHRDVSPRTSSSIATASPRSSTSGSPRQQAPRTKTPIPTSSRASSRTWPRVPAQSTGRSARRRLGRWIHPLPILDG